MNITYTQLTAEQAENGWIQSPRCCTDSVYATWSDTELIAKYKSTGDSEIIEYLYARYYPLIYSTMAKATSDSYVWEYEDRMQEAMIVLIELVNYWDPASVKKHNNITFMLRNRMITRIQKWKVENGYTSEVKEISLSEYEEMGDGLVNELVDENQEGDWSSREKVVSFLEDSFHVLNAKEVQAVRNKMHFGTLEHCKNKSTQYRHFDNAIKKIKDFYNI